MADSSTISLSGVSKRYGSVEALRDVSLEVRPGEVLGLIGENGAGKSTLIGVLSGSVRPDAGSLTVHGDRAPLGDARALSALGISVVVQEQALVDALRVYENIFLGRESQIAGRGPGRRRRLRAAARALLETLEIETVDADAVVADLSYPQRQLVEIAKAFSRTEEGAPAPLILLDEPTSALTESEVELLFSLVQRWRDRVAFIFVSHILLDVLRISTRLLVLRDGRVIETLPNEGVSVDRLHELMVGVERGADYYHEEEQGGSRDQMPLLALRNAGVDGEFDGVDLALHPGEVLGLAGVVGSGKSTLAAVVAGEIRLTRGDVHLGGRRRARWNSSKAVREGVLYVPPERAQDSLFLTASVRFNISIGFLDLLSSPWSRLLRLRAERKRALELAQQLSVKVGSLSTPVGELSGGNQQKAVFARWQGRACRVLVLNDPTRGIDVGTREQIYRIIRELAARGVAILLCAESLEELIGLSDRILVMRDGRLSAELTFSATGKPAEVDVIKHMM